MRKSSLLVMAALLGPAAAFGQTDIRESVAGFAPAYFASSQPSSALDMVRLLPGFRLIEGDPTVRGYSGAQGNVLIDSRPPASKQETLEELLKRIPAGDVDHIELIRPGAAGVDMQDYAVLANVVRKASSGLRGRAEFETVYYPHFDMVSPKLSGQLSVGSEEILDLSGSVERHVNEQMGGNGPRDRYALNGTPLFLSEINSPRYEDDWTVEATWRQPFLGGKLRLNGLVKDTRGFSKSPQRETFPSTVLTVGTDRDIEFNSEMGLQYQRALWTGGEAELVGIRRASSQHYAQTLVSPTSADTSIQADYKNETIQRLALRQRAGALLLEGGAESAINTLVNNLAYTTNGTNIPLPGANVRISEWRNEFFGIATWRPWDELTLEPGLRYEMSHLKQQGDFQLVKDLFYLKPHLRVSWKPTAKDELRMVYERQAGQLDFANFVPTLMLSSNQISVGNRDLVPYTLWLSEVAWERRFSHGSMVLTARRENISNVVDRIPVYSPSGVYDGVGNIGNGRRDELQADFIQPLDDLGLDGVTVQGTLLRRFSQVTDPTTHQRRQITADLPIEAKVTLTQDLPQWRIRWGATYNHSSYKITYKFNEVKRDKQAETVDAFIEYKPGPEWLIRASAKNILDRPFLHSRDIYGGPRGIAPFNYLETRPAIIGAHFGIDIQRTF